MPSMPTALLASMARMVRIFTEMEILININNKAENMLICGVDEAGRGPVIGPLVMAGVLIDEKDEDKLIALEVKDSKLLTPKQREGLFGKIKKIAKDYKIIIISPKEIDEAVESDTLNLNWLEALKTAEIANILKPDKLIVDSPSNNLEAYSAYLKKHINKKINLIAEHKADETYPVVSAASILAKVTRDNEIDKIKKKYGNIGSGYPADPITQEFLRKNYGKYPEIFRHSWQSFKQTLKKASQRSLSEF